MPAAQSGPVWPDIALAAIIALPWLRGASPVAWAWQAKCAGPSAPTGPTAATSARAPGLSSLCSGHGFGTDQRWRGAQTHPKKRHSGLWRQAERLRGQGATRRRGCGLSVERGAATTSRRQSFLPSGGLARTPCLAAPAPGRAVGEGAGPVRESSHSVRAARPCSQHRQRWGAGWSLAQAGLLSEISEPIHGLKCTRSSGKRDRCIPTGRSSAHCPTTVTWSGSPV